MELGILGEAIPIDRRKAVEEFAAGLSTLADDTVRQYMTSLGMFGAVVGDKLIRDIDGTDIDAFISGRMPKSSEATVAEHVRALKAFFNWAVKRGYAAENPVKLATRLLPVHNVLPT
jgi:site-specific recombinase XerD